MPEASHAPHALAAASSTPAHFEKEEGSRMGRRAAHAEGGKATRYSLHIFAAPKIQFGNEI